MIGIMSSSSSTYTAFMQGDDYIKKINDEVFLGFNCKRLIVVKNNMRRYDIPLIDHVYSKVTFRIYYSTYKHTKR